MNAYPWLESLKLDDCETLHKAAENGNLKKNPILTSEALAEKDMFESTVWNKAATYKTLKDIPTHLLLAKPLHKLIIMATQFGM